MAGMKATFFYQFFTQPGPTSWPQKAQRRNSLNSIFIEKDRKVHFYFQFCDFKTLRITNFSFSNPRIYQQKNFKNISKQEDRFRRPRAGATRVRQNLHRFTFLFLQLSCHQSGDIPLASS